MNRSVEQILHFKKLGDKCDCESCELIRELAKNRWENK